MADFIRREDAEGQRRFEELLANRFPAISAQINEVERRLLHLEMGVSRGPPAHNTNQVFHGRKLHRGGRLDVEPAAPLVSVQIAEVVNGEQRPEKLYSGTIVVEVGRGRIRIEGSVDAETLRIILERPSAKGEDRRCSTTSAGQPNSGSKKASRR